MSSFSVRGLTIAVAFAAIACGALIKPTEPWLVILLGVTAALLVGGPIAALASSGARRHFWMGASVVGWAYFLLVWLLSNIPFKSNTAVVASNIDYFLPTQRLLVFVADQFIDDPTDDWRNLRKGASGSSTSGGGFFQLGSGISGDPYTGGPSATPTPTNFPIIGSRAAFLLSGHLLWTLLFACMGGTALRHSYLRKAKAQTAAASI